MKKWIERGQDFPCWTEKAMYSFVDTIQINCFADKCSQFLQNSLKFKIVLLL